MNGSIISYGFINKDEFISPAGKVKHPGTDLFDIPRESVYDEPYRPFGKMGNAEKLLFSTTALALKNCDIPESSGIVLVTPKGSLETDRAYMKTLREEFPSPALFAATLPSAPIAELAIPFTLRGPNRVIADDRGESGLLNSLFLLKRGTPIIICSFCNPNPVNGYAAVLVISSKTGGVTELSFAKERNSIDINSDIFQQLIAHIHGKTDIHPEFKMTTTIGTFTVKVN